MTRKEMYDFIKSNGLQSKLSRNYTQCSNTELESVIEKFNKSKSAEVRNTKCAPVSAPTPKTCTCKNEAKVINDPLKAAVIAMLTVLDNAGILDDLLEELDNND